MPSELSQGPFTALVIIAAEAGSGPSDFEIEGSETRRRLTL